VTFSLRAIFLDNLFLKLISLGIAVSLYIYVRGERNETTTVAVPVEYVGAPAGKVLVSAKVDQVSVTLSAPWSLFRKVETAAPKYVIDISDGKNQDVFFDKHRLADPSSRATVEEVLPQMVSLRFEDRVDGEAPITAEFSGVAARGFEPLGTPLPARVGVSGAMSAIAKLKSISTAPIDVTGKSEAFEVTGARLSPPPPFVELKVVAPEVKVAVTFREVPVEKWYSGVPIVGEGTDWDVQIDPAWVSVKLTGPVKVIDALDGGALRVVLNLKEEDRKGPGTYVRPLAAATVRGLPEGRGVAVTSFSEEVVTLRLGAAAPEEGSGPLPAAPGAPGAAPAAASPGK